LNEIKHSDSYKLLKNVYRRQRKNRGEGEKRNHKKNSQKIELTITNKDFKETQSEILIIQ